MIENLVVHCPMLKVVDNKSVHHVMFTGCVVHAGTVLYISVLVQPKVIMWYYLLVNRRGKKCVMRKVKNIGHSISIAGLRPMDMQ